MLAPGFQSEWGTSISIWRRVKSTLTVGARPLTAEPSDACTRSATIVEPDGCTVRNRSAGAVTLAPSGNGYTVPGVPPIAIENATSEGFWSVLSVTRKAVALLSGLTRNSTRSAALLA